MPPCLKSQGRVFCQHLTFFCTDKVHRRTDWAEEEDEDSLTLPAPQVTKNKDGTETIVSWSFREDGKKVKTTRRIKKTVVKQVVNPRVAERKQWTKFGADKSKPTGPSTDTTSVAENIVFRPQANWKASTADEKNENEKKKAELKNAKIKCRICSGDHWTTKCPFKDTMAPEGEATAVGPDVEESDAGALGQGSSSYVPPHLRGRGGAAAAGEKMGGKYERDDLATLRVTNVRTKDGGYLGRAGADGGYRSARSPRNKTSATSSRDSVMSPEFSLPRTARLDAQRASPLSALLTGTTPRRRARRWTAVS